MNPIRIKNQRPIPTENGYPLEETKAYIEELEGIIGEINRVRVSEHLNLLTHIEPAPIKMLQFDSLAELFSSNRFIEAMAKCNGKELDSISVSFGSPKFGNIERKKYYFNGLIEFGHYPKDKEKGSMWLRMIDIKEKPIV